MKNVERAIRIWQVLIGLARNRQTITDENLGELIGVENILDELIQPLKLLENYCRVNELPHLVYLVILKRADIFEQNLRLTESWDKEREDVFNFEWYKMKPIDKNGFTILL